MAKLSVYELSPRRWKDVEELFGKNGACGGCWCMFWRIRKGESWNAVKGASNRKDFKRLVESGRAHGVLAYLDDEPVGWCSFDRKPDYEKLARSPSLRSDDAADVWSIPCFFVKAGFRGRGVATALLRAALDALKKLKARIVEGYPVKTRGPMAAVFAYTGTVSLFRKAGFTIVQGKESGKQRARIALTGRRDENSGAGAACTGPGGTPRARKRPR